MPRAGIAPPAHTKGAGGSIGLNGWAVVQAKSVLHPEMQATSSMGCCNPHRAATCLNARVEGPVCAVRGTSLGEARAYGSTNEKIDANTIRGVRLWTSGQSKPRPIIAQLSRKRNVSEMLSQAPPTATMSTCWVTLIEAYEAERYPIP